MQEIIKYTMKGEGIYTVTLPKTRKHFYTIKTFVPTALEDVSTNCWWNVHWEYSRIIICKRLCSCGIYVLFTFIELQSVRKHQFQYITQISNFGYWCLYKLWTSAFIYILKCLYIHLYVCFIFMYSCLCICTVFFMVYIYGIHTVLLAVGHCSKFLPTSSEYWKVPTLHYGYFISGIEQSQVPTMHCGHSDLLSSWNNNCATTENTLFLLS